MVDEDLWYADDVYLCNGKQYCNSSPNCYLNGGECSHTKFLKYAKNFVYVGVNRDGRLYSSLPYIDNNIKKGL